MLVLHPSSRCDVCLDSYTWQTIAQSPHAIPCGHVFCRPCLFALSSYICPLCRKKFEPHKAKKLHVDRPENVDENRESDLLQRLAVSWEAPEDKLRALTFEVDTWLDTRADDTCIVLRKARAALARHQELKKAETTLESALTDIHTRYKDMAIDYDVERRKALATETKLNVERNALIRENEDLKAEIKELRTASESYGYVKNPLPPPPKPVSIEYIPTFAQAMAHDRVRFDLPPSPTDSPYAQSFEVETRRRHKGKAKSVDRRLVSPTSQSSHPLPTHLAKTDSTEEGPTLTPHFGHHSPRPSDIAGQRRTSTPGPKRHFENTNQPLDVYELTHTYLREFSQGFLDGRLMTGKAASWSSKAQQPHASTSRSNVPLPENNESIGARSPRSTRSTRGSEVQPVPGSSIGDWSFYAPQRHDTVSSIATSAESYSGEQQSQSRSRSRSGTRQISNPSVDSAPSRVPVVPPPIPPSNPNMNPQRFHGQQLEPARINSPATSHLSNTSSWGTVVSTSTNLTTYSLLGLRDFREGSYPLVVDSDEVNTWSSPARRVSTMVGVVPAHETVGASNAASPRTRSSRTGPQRLSQYPPPSPSLNSWHASVGSLSPAEPQTQFPPSNGYHSDDENENVVRPHEFLNPNYSRDSMGSRTRTREHQRMTRGRNQPLPAVSPSFSFSFGEPIPEEEGGNQNLVETFGNALGLELATSISAPTPVVPHLSFLRSFSDET